MMDAKLESIMLRMCQLGHLLPDIRDFDLDDENEVAEAGVVIAEFRKTYANLFARMKELRDAKT